MQPWTLLYISAAVLLGMHADAQQALYRDCECTCRLVGPEIASISADVLPETPVEEVTENLESNESPANIDDDEDRDYDDAGSGIEFNVDDIFPNLPDPVSAIGRPTESTAMRENGDPANIIGKAGLPGSKGMKGDKGELGVQGANGNKGEKGEIGFHGPDGYPGPIGNNGEKGERGDVGLRGYPGAQGPQGYRGPEGPRGETGFSGKRGNEGPQGPRGLPGSVGSRGPQGEPGSRGADGMRGPPGPGGAAIIPGGKTAFVARLENNLGPTIVATNVLFTAVDINKGQGYDPSSGSFLATYSGVYVFHLQVMALADHVAWLTIQVNEEAVTFAWASGYTTGQEQMGTTMTIQALEVGDVVNVVLRANSEPPNYLYAHYTLFSGYLLGGE